MAVSVSRKRRSHHAQRSSYSLLDVMLASPKAPMPEDKRLHQLTVMWQGLQSIEVGDEPCTNDWRVVSDAVNLMETLVSMGHVADESGLLNDAITALAMAGRRHLKGHPIRLNGEGIQAVRAVLEDYSAALDGLSHRTMVECHRATEKRMREILAGRSQPHDVEVVDL